MLHSLLRSQKCRQIGQVSLNIKVSSAGVVSGPDAAFVSGVAHVALSGLYVITLKEASRIALHVSGLVPITTGQVAQWAASTISTVSVQIKTDAGVAADGDFSVQILLATDLSYYL